RDFMAHLALEEKEHVAEAVLLLRRLDPDQNADFEKDIQLAHFSEHGSEAPTLSASPAPSTHGPVPRPSVSGSTRQILAKAASDFTVGGPNPELPSTPHDAGAALHSVPAAPSGHALPLTVGSLRHQR